MRIKSSYMDLNNKYFLFQILFLHMELNNKINAVHDMVWRLCGLYSKIINP